MEDGILRSFLARQFEEGMALSGLSDVLDLVPFAGGAALDGPEPAQARGGPPSRYLARFRCDGLVRRGDGSVHRADDFLVGIRFPSDYLRRAHSFEVVTVLAPREVFHPNARGAMGLLCLGRLHPGTSLVDILYQAHEILTWKKVGLAEPLDPDAAAWAREPANRGRFPVDTRPLRRREPDRGRAAP